MNKYSNSRPNVLLFVTDQQRFDTLGCMGNSFVNTPNLDRLASGGVLFERSYCQSPVCTPSRASFLTGRYPRTTRCRANGQDMPPDERLISRVLADNGYYCLLAGKLHLAPCGPSVCPIQEHRIDDGFIEFHWGHNPSGIGNAGHPEHGGTYWSGNRYSHWLFEQGQTYGSKNYDKMGYVKYGMDEDYHFTKWCADQAIHQIRYHAAEKKAMPFYPSQPWFFNINTFDPHHAFDPPKRLLEKYLEIADKLPLPSYIDGEWLNKSVFQQIDHQHAYNITDPPHHFCFEEMCADEHRMIKAAYYAMIENIDIQLGRIVDALEETGEIDNTIIIFTSDHGEMLGDHGIYLKGPYCYEEMIHIPLIMYWKDHFKPAKVNALVELTDIVPTLEEFCIGKVESGVQGKSLADILTGETSPEGHRDSIYCEYYECMPWHQNPKAYVTMAYDGRFKILRSHRSKEGELYDLLNDPHEFDNLWDRPEYAGEKIRMLELLTDRMADTVDPMPPIRDRW